MELTPLKTPVKRLTMIKRSGIVFYHRSVDKDDFDEMLFSGLTSAILTFSQEMHEDLSSIKMKELELHFKIFEDIIFVIGVSPDSNLNPTDLDNLVNEINQTENFQNLVNEIEKGIQYFDKEFDESIRTMMQISELESTIETPKNFQFSNLVSMISQIKAGEIKPRDLAVQLIGKELTEKEIKSKRFATEMLQEFLKSANLDKEVENKLNEVLKYMLDRTTRASTKTSKALF